MNISFSWTRNENSIPTSWLIFLPQAQEEYTKSAKPQNWISRETTDDILDRIRFVAEQCYKNLGWYSDSRIGSNEIVFELLARVGDPDEFGIPKEPIQQVLDFLILNNRTFELFELALEFAVYSLKNFPASQQTRIHINAYASDFLDDRFLTSLIEAKEHLKKFWKDRWHSSIVIELIERDPRIEERDSKNRSFYSQEITIRIIQRMIEVHRLWLFSCALDDVSLFHEPNIGFNIIQILDRYKHENLFDVIKVSRDMVEAILRENPNNSDLNDCPTIAFLVELYRNQVHTSMLVCEQVSNIHEATVIQNNLFPLESSVYMQWRDLNWLYGRQKLLDFSSCKTSSIQEKYNRNLVFGS